jgi:hypothetical protein
MCTRPCWGTPREIGRIAEAGFWARLEESVWPASHGLPETRVFAPALVAGSCTFYSSSGCELHALGLKPVEGRLALCGGRHVPGVRFEVARAWSVTRHLP